MLYKAAAQGYVGNDQAASITVVAFARSGTLAAKAAYRAVNYVTLVAAEYTPKHPKSIIYNFQLTDCGVLVLFAISFSGVAA